MKNIIYSFIAIFLLTGILEAKEPLFEKDYDVSFKEEQAQIKKIKMDYLKHDNTIVTEEGDILILLDCNWSNLPDAELNFPAIVKFDKDYNLLWQTEIKADNNLVNFSMDTLDNSIYVEANYCTERVGNYGWSNCFPALFILSESGEILVEYYGEKGSTPGYYYQEKAKLDGDKYVYFKRDDRGVVFQYRGLDNFEVLRSDTIIPQGEGAKRIFMINDFKEVGEGIFIIVGPAGPKLNESSIAILVYNSNDSTSFMIESEDLAPSTLISEVFIANSKAIVHSSKSIVLIDLETFEVISSINDGDFRNHDKYATAHISSVDINENDEFIIPVYIKEHSGAKLMYHIFKTDINFNILWEISFVDPDGDRLALHARQLANGNVLTARMINFRPTETLRLQELEYDLAGIGELSQKASLSLYPNPASDKLFIQTDASVNSLQAGDVQIINTLGVEVAGFALSSFSRENGGYSIDVSHLASGVYFVKMGASTAKFIVTK